MNHTYTHSKYISIVFPDLLECGCFSLEGPFVGPNLFYAVRDFTFLDHYFKEFVTYDRQLHLDVEIPTELKRRQCDT
jgi:hypothetical protein